MYKQQEAILLNEEEELTGTNMPLVIVVVDTSCAGGANYASLPLLHL